MNVGDKALVASSLWRPRVALIAPAFTATRFIPTTTVRLQCTDLSGRNGSYG